MLDMQQKLEHRQAAKHRAQLLRSGLAALDENAVWSNCVSVGRERLTEHRLVGALERWKVIRGYRSTPLRLLRKGLAALFHSLLRHGYNRWLAHAQRRSKAKRQLKLSQAEMVGQGPRKPWFKWRAQTRNWRIIRTVARSLRRLHERRAWTTWTDHVHSHLHKRQAIAGTLRSLGLDGRKSLRPAFNCAPPRRR